MAVGAGGGSTSGRGTHDYITYLMGTPLGQALMSMAQPRHQHDARATSGTPYMPGFGYGTPSQMSIQPGLGLGGYGGGYAPGPGFNVTGNPNTGVPSPGLGTGAPNPRMYEDFSSGYPGAQNDPLLALMQSWLNRAHPNGM